MTDLTLSRLSLNIIHLISDFLNRADLFEFHLTSKRVHKNYWESLYFQCFFPHPTPESISSTSLSTYPAEVLINIIKLTKLHKVLSPLGSLSLSVLIKRNFQFFNQDFSHIMIQNSDLSSGVFQSVDFSCSRLKGCDFSRAFISDCNFFGSSLQNSDFGFKIVAGHLQTVTCLAISDDNQLLVSTGYDRLIKLWDLPSFKLVKTIQTGHNGAVSALCLSSDRGLLISAELEVRLWDLELGSCRYLKGNNEKVTGVSMSRGNGVFVTASIEGTVMIWKTETGRAKKKVQVGEQVLAVMMAPDGKEIFVGGKKGSLFLIDRKGKVRVIREANLVAVRTVFLDMKFLVIGNDDGIVELKDRTGSKIRDYFGHCDVVTCVKIVNRALFSSGGERDCSIKKWDLNSSNCIDVIMGHTSSINSFVVFNSYIISAGKDKVIRMSKIKIQSQPSDWIECLSILNNSSVATGSGKSGVNVWSEGVVQRAYETPSRVMSICSMEETIAIGCWDMKIYIYQQSLIATLVGHSDAVISLQFLNTYLFSGSADGTIKIWLWSENYCTNSLQLDSGYVHKVVASSKYAIGTCGYSLTRLAIWDLEQDSTFTFSIPRGRVKALDICEDFFVTGGSETPFIEVWSFTGDMIKRNSKHSGCIMQVKIFNDFIISSAEDKWIFVWDWRNDVIVSKYFGFTSSYFSIKDDLQVLACESKGTSVQLHEFDVSDCTNMKLLWRTLEMFETRNCNYRKSKNLSIEQIGQLEDYISYIR